MSLLLLVLACASTPAKAEWLRAESPNFILFSDEPESRVRERMVQLESFDRLLRALTTVNDPPAPNKLSIYIVSGAEALRTISQVPPGIVGFYTATPYGTAAYVDRTSGGADRESRERAAAETLFHEYVHHFMLQYRPNAYPAWYVEGFAEYFATTQIRERTIDIGNFSPGRAYAVVEGSWLPIDRVLFGSVEGLGPEPMSQFYAQSWLLVHYFFSTPERQAALGRYLVEARRGDGAAALQRATGLTPAQLNDELHRYIRGGQIRYRRLNLDERQAAPAINVTPMTAAAGDLILYEGALRIGIPDDRRASYLERIRAAAARHSGDTFAARVQAHAEALFGDGAAADRLLQPLLAAAPNDAELMYIAGMRHLRAAEEASDGESETRAARSWFIRAHRADENHYPTLYRYAESLRGEREFLSENTANILLLAHQLAPQVAEITMNAAGVLISRGDFDEAEALLRPLAADPHERSLAEAAERMIREARSRAAAHSQAQPAH